MRVNWNPANMAKAKALRESGMVWRDIAAAMGCSAGACRYALTPQRRERCLAYQAKAREKLKPPGPKLFPYVGQDQDY